jgi:xanthine dehydrogenase YagS FAD-binding subunit
MTPFHYERASDVSAALAAGARAGAQYLGGGTNLVDLMRETIERPEILVDVTGLSRDIEDTEGGGLRIGAGVKNTAVAADRRVRPAFPAARSGDPRRRLRPDPQHGDSRRQSHAAHPLHLFL